MDAAVIHAPSPQHRPRESSGLAGGIPPSSSPAHSGLLQRAFSQMQSVKGTPTKRSSGSARRPLSFADAALELRSIAALDLGSLDLSDFPEDPGQPGAAGGQAPGGTCRQTPAPSCEPCLARTETRTRLPTRPSIADVDVRWRLEATAAQHSWTKWRHAGCARPAACRRIADDRTI